MKAQSEYGFDGGQGDSSTKVPSISENLMLVSVYFDSFNIKHILNQKVYEVKSDALSPYHLWWNIAGRFWH